MGLLSLSQYMSENLLKDAIIKMQAAKKELEYLKAKIRIIHEIRIAESLDSFIKDRVILDKLCLDYITCVDIWRSYRYWFEMTNSRCKKLTIAEFSNALKSKFGEPTNEGYNGMHVFNTEEDMQTYYNDKCASRG